VLHHTEGPDIAKAWTEGNLKSNMEDPLWNLAMSVEDSRIEKQGASKFRGDALSISDGTEIVMEKYIDTFKNMPPDKLKVIEGDKYASGMLAEIAASLSSRLSWCAGAATHITEFVDMLPDKSKEGLKKLLDAGYDEDLRHLTDEASGLVAAKRAFEILFDEDAEEHAKNMKQEGEGQSGQGNSDTGDGGGDSNQSGSGEGKSGEEEKSQSSGKEKGKCDRGESTGEFKTDGGKVDYLDLLLSPHGGSKGVGGTGISIDYDRYHRSTKDMPSFDPTPLKEIQYKDYKSGVNTIRYGRDNDQKENTKAHYERATSIDKTSRPFANKVARLLKTKSQARYQGAQKKGKVDRTNAYRLGVKQVGNGEWTRRIFRKKTTDDVLDTAVQIVVDFSGSMSGTKMVYAINSASLLNRTLSKSLHMPVEVIGFSEVGSGTVMGVLKPFDASISNDVLKDNMFDFTRYMGYNADGEAIAWSAMRLRRRKEKRKVMIVLSDGSPACYKHGDIFGYTKKIIEEIEREKVMEIYGIGICDNNVTKLYKEHGVISDPMDLEKAVLEVIKKKLL